MRFPLAVRLVLFDLDGTLVHSAPDLAYAVNLMLKELGRDEQPQDRVAGWVGDRMIRMVKRALTGRVDGEPEASLFERGRASFKVHYAAHLAVRARSFPGVVEATPASRPASRSNGRFLWGTRRTTCWRRAPPGCTPSP